MLIGSWGGHGCDSTKNWNFDGRMGSREKEKRKEKNESRDEPLRSGAEIVYIAN